MIDPDAIRAWLEKQKDADGDFGGTCEYDHDGADRHINALLAEVERLRIYIDTTLQAIKAFS